MKTSGKSRRIGAPVAVVFGFALAGACESQSSSSRVGGETHWLDACDQDADCERGGCLCGVCTEPCAGDDSCAAENRQAGCFAVASPGLVGRCGSTTKAHGVCLALCAKDAECPGGDRCHLGACVARTASGADASTAEVDPPLPQASDFADVDAAMDLSKPVVLPEPSTTITDATDAFLGTWSAEGEPGGCTFAGGCVNLEVTKNGSIAVGHVYFVSSGQPRQSDVPQGPFAPAVDPNVGYPTEVGPDRYIDLSNNEMDGPRYRMLDGVVHGNQLSFWYSYADLWNDWCNLQTPHELTIHGAQAFRCVDAAANETNTDLGKLKLCRSPFDDDQCLTKQGAQWPCSCVEQQSASCLPLGSCLCTATGCTANVRAEGVFRRADLSLQGDALKGVWTESLSLAFPIEFHRVAP